MQPIRAYFDTSVFGGVFDVEFAEHSKALFDRVTKGEVLVLVSGVTRNELSRAPAHVREHFAAISTEAIRHCEIDEETIQLALTYIERRVIGPKWRDDAIHVAAATLHRADVLVSWNFRHIVRWDRVRAFNEVNAALGHPPVTICSPAELRYAGNNEDV